MVYRIIIYELRKSKSSFYGLTTFSSYCKDTEQVNVLTRHPLRMFLPSFKLFLPHQLVEISELFQSLIHLGQKSKAVVPDLLILGHNHDGIEKVGDGRLHLS